MRSGSHLEAAAAERVIVHMDVDAFAVAVERLRDKRLVGRPVLIGAQGARALVLSASSEARQRGVYPGMPVRQARALCPEAAVVQGDFAHYHRVSDTLRALVQEQVPLLEFAAQDEFYLDLTGMDRYFGCFQFAQELKTYIRKETGLTVSFAQATTKPTAKVATDDVRPDGAREISPGTERAYLAPLPVRRLPGVGRETQAQLHDIGIREVRAMQAVPPEAMERLLGRPGLTLWHRAHGTDRSPVVAYSERKAIHREQVFTLDTIDIPALRALLVWMAEDIGHELRASERLTANLTVRIRYSNGDTQTKSARLPYTALDPVLIEEALRLFDRVYERRMTLRLLGLEASHLVPGGIQLSLLDDRPEQMALLSAIDKMKHRFGTTSVQQGRSLKAYERKGKTDKGWWRGIRARI